MTHLLLNQTERNALLGIPTSHKKKSGFAHFIVTLGGKCDPNTGSIDLTPEDIARIQRYIKRYKSGGYQAILKKAFVRPLNLKYPAAKKKV